MSQPELSVVIPAYNESENIGPLLARLIPVLQSTGLAHEIVFVDDGSRDQTRRIIQDEIRRNKAIRLVAFSRNFGHEAATSAGLQQARGQAVVLMDADLQDPPEVIPQLIEKWREGYQVVYAIRAKRHEESLVKRATSAAFYRILSRMSPVDIPRDTGDFRLIDRRALDSFNQLTERNRFVRGMFGWVGYKQTGVPFVREGRHAGKTKYNYGKLIRLAIDSLLSFTIAPLQIAMMIGFLISAASLVGIALIIYNWIVGNPVEGWTSLATIIIFIGGMIISLLGVIGEYVGKIYIEAQNRPLYIIDQVIDQDSLDEQVVQTSSLRHVVPTDS